ncbi:MAG: AbrB/MazE/SpoVT family DNA-binding domain-containing protein [Chloroflexota bacterium]|nr:AbrB/MazE/SpoVT family DNA-binding domain-containing protein [Chloroflexota bacterium]
MNIVKVAIKGQIVIPAELRKKYHIVTGTRVMVAERDGEIVLKPLLSSPVEEAKGMFKGGESALKALLQDRAEEAKR